MISAASCRVHLAEQVCRILEDAAFMLVEDPEAPPPPPAMAIEASLSFGGPANGVCWLVVSEKDAQRLACEMLGTDQDENFDLSACNNATSELLNILTAWVLDDWWGDDVEHTLGVPETRRLPLAQTRVWSLPDSERVIVSTDCGCTFLSGVTLE